MKIKKMVVAGVLAASLICMQNLSVSANNWSDTSFSVKYSGDGSEDIVTSARAKQDSSASYNNNGGSNTTDINVCVYGVKNNTYNVCSYVLPVRKGEKKYISNKVYPKYTKACLGASTQNHRSHTISGWWSPDNLNCYK